MPSVPLLHVLADILRCPHCDPPAILSQPTTARNGITVCAAHANAHDLTLLPSIAPSLPPLFPPSPHVTFYPSPTSSLTPSSNASVDVTVNKFINLVKHAQELSRDECTTRHLEDTDAVDAVLNKTITVVSAIAHSQDIGSTTSPALARFKQELLLELSCEICFSLLFEPVTTPCQHTFCSQCLQRSLDHSILCPICRQDLPGYAYFQQHPHNRVIVNTILTVFPDLYQERATAKQQEGESQLNTPIFVCQLSLPGIPTLLQIFEPRYRLMLRRCLASPQPRFGMIMPPDQATEFGTMLEIRSVQMLPDGRSMVETWGTSRFRILERGVLDGYMVARVEHFNDISSEDELSLLSTSSPAPTLEDFMAVCHDFLHQLRQVAAPWVVQRMDNASQFMPSDPVHFAFWMALILPIHEREKAKLLVIRSARLRLQLVVHWIEHLRDSWWFNSRCHIC